MLATRVTAICIALGLHLLTNAQPTNSHGDGRAQNQHMGKRHTNQTVHHDRDGSRASGDMEGPKSDAEKSRGGKGMKDEKKDRESGSDSMHIHNFTRHAGMGGMGDRANRTRANKTRANRTRATWHDAHEPAGQREAVGFGHQTRRDEMGQRHYGHGSNGFNVSVTIRVRRNVSARNSNLGEVAGTGEKETKDEEGKTDPSSSNLFIGASVAGGVLAALVVAACWRWRGSSCCSYSNQKDAQLEAATTIVVGCTSPNACDKNNAKNPELSQEGPFVVVGMPIENNVDLEIAMGKPVQK